MKAFGLFFGLIVSISAFAENRVSVIDTGLDVHNPKYKPYLCKQGHKDFTGFGLMDNDGHGTIVVDYIIQNAKTQNYCLVILKFFDPFFREGTTQSAINAAKEAVLLQSTIVNMSLSGEGFIEDEKRVFLSAPNTIFVVAAGNDNVNLDLSPRYPASYDSPNIMPVGAIDFRTGEKQKKSNYGSRVVNWEEASCTSYATAVKTGKLISQLMGGSSQ